MQSKSQCQKSKTDFAFPWEHIPPGGGFFIPTLNPQRTIEKAARAAIKTRAFNTRHVVCIVNGQFGVYFRRLKTPSASLD